MRQSSQDPQALLRGFAQRALPRPRSAPPKPGLPQGRRRSHLPRGPARQVHPAADQSPLEEGEPPSPGGR